MLAAGVPYTRIDGRHLPMLKWSTARYTNRIAVRPEGKEARMLRFANTIVICARQRVSDAGRFGKQRAVVRYDA
ncbi:MAG: hypothetical protein DCC58_08880 [Chloroflexi bacterium]|nr:MAG: hypothetical protein DCC58_08880 [Chloroflexota bacterium]